MLCNSQCLVSKVTTKQTCGVLKTSSAYPLQKRTLASSNGIVPDPTFVGRPGGGASRTVPSSPDNEDSKASTLQGTLPSSDATMVMDRPSGAGGRGVSPDASSSSVRSEQSRQDDGEQAPSSVQMLLMGLGYVAIVGVAFLAHGMIFKKSSSIGAEKLATVATTPAGAAKSGIRSK
ncbi:hypothetical protein CEUSTIGMA_g9678.t1 [Chlamydomonas eustigma]|uniref:Uncharacterized protein n=1 Tax=Chlamydomonas eustigma TaxID=1157962 RepID=A0A250XHH1_9CHLO|nr:hypothetical protein CEUSTIGMA_g9678.t1 [Chlamydomonas eustigma]|eukprot:GAX82250.1 hypothetical protein CEUSTIGMA_g9678.t1 [Chlamydomonas eustigma]